MKTMTNQIGVGAFALPFQAPTSGTVQGTGVPTAAAGLRPTGGAAPRLRARDLSVAPDSLPGGPVI